jgi:S-adenosylmethionine decarboxylase proenzyme
MNVVLIDLYDCDPNRLDDLDLIRQGMVKAAEIMGATVKGHSFHAFEPWGISGTVIIAESHLGVHTWPEYEFAGVTFETCGQRLHHKKAYNFLIQLFLAKKHNITFLRRGFIDSLKGTSDRDIKETAGICSTADR